MAIAFVSRAKCRLTPTARIRCWQSVDGRFAIEEVTNLFGLPRRILAVERLANGNERILSRHRTRPAAIRALARREGKGERDAPHRGQGETKRRRG